MKKIVSVLIVLIMSLGICGVAFAEDTDANAAVKEKYGLENLSNYDYSKFKGKNITINVANWGEYMSVNDPESLDVNKAFEELTGVKVNYKTVSTNEELYAKLNGGGADYDIIIPSDYMISRMIDEKMIQKLNFANIPNVKYIDQKFKSTGYDPTNEYSVPYMWGIVCLIYNTKKVTGTVDSWNALWDSNNQKGGILMFNNPRDAFGIALLRRGYSINTENKDELKKAADDLKAQKPLVQAYVMDEIFDKMTGGSAAIAPYYAGDAVTMMKDNPDLAYAIPKEGTNQFVDAVCVPTNSKNKDAAEMYINFLCETDVALANCEYVGYSTPQTETYKLLPEETRNSPLQYPDASYLKTKTQFFTNLSTQTNQYTQELWNEIKIDKKLPVWVIPVILAAAIGATILIVVRRAKKKKEDIF